MLQGIVAVVGDGGCISQEGKRERLLSGFLGCFVKKSNGWTDILQPLFNRRAFVSGHSQEVNVTEVGAAGGRI